MLSPFEKGGEHSEGAEGDLSNKISPNPSFSKRGMNNYKRKNPLKPVESVSSVFYDQSRNMLSSYKVYMLGKTTMGRIV